MQARACHYYQSSMLNATQAYLQFYEDVMGGWRGAEAIKLWGQLHLNAQDNHVKDGIVNGGPDDVLGSC